MIKRSRTRVAETVSAKSSGKGVCIRLSPESTIRSASLLNVHTPFSSEKYELHIVSDTPNVKQDQPIFLLLLQGQNVTRRDGAYFL